METKEKNGSVTVVAMPHNNDAERAVLGAMLIENNVIDRIATRLSADYFYNTQNRRMFGVIVGMWKLGQSVDQLTVVDALLEAGKLDEAGGAGWTDTTQSEAKTNGKTRIK